MILIVLGLAVRVSTLPTFLRKMYGGKGGKAKTPWAFSFQAKRMTQDRKAKGQRSGRFYINLKGPMRFGLERISKSKRPSK